MNFDRFSLQPQVELLAGCDTAQKWKEFKKRLVSLELDSVARAGLQDALKSDALSFFQRSLYSFSGAYSDLRMGNRSWGVIKLYYSLFYALRSRLFAKKHIMIRNECWFHLDMNVGTSDGPIAPRKLSGARYRNDHETALSLYEDIFGESDLLLSNQVEGQRPLRWVMDLRNVANYRMARFTDPSFPHDVIDADLLSHDDIDSVVESNVRDNSNVLLFQPEHVWIALPMKQMLAASADVLATDYSTTVSGAEAAHVREVMRSLPSPVRDSLPSIDRLFVAAE